MQKRLRMGEILLRAGAIDKFQLEAALGEQARWGRPIGATLIKLGFIDEHDLVRAVATQLNLSVARLDGKQISPEMIAIVPPSVARTRMILPLFVKEAGIRRTLFVGVEDPADLEAFDDLAFRTGMDVKPVMVCPSELHAAIDQYYDPGEDDEAWALRFKKDEEPESDVSQGPDVSVQAVEEIEEIEEIEAVEAVERVEKVEKVERVEKVEVTPGTQALADFWSAPSEDEASPALPSPAPATDGPAEFGESSCERIITVEVLAPPVEEEPETAELSLDDLHTEEPLDPYSVKSRIMLHALSDLLIEKGVITREELGARVRDLQSSDGVQETPGSDDDRGQPRSD
jgi:hypothetical protein